MNSSINTTLIALLLAIKELQTPLSKDEQVILQDVGQQLDIDPDYQGERTGFLKPLLGMDLDEKIGYIKKRRNPCY
jgi:hypothetical protein